MAVPDQRLTLIDSTEELVYELLNDLFIQPRSALLKWSQITNQTAQVRIAYPGQHLASLITGVPGSGTAARGDDLRDGSEVKSCSRADQLGICRSCEERVLPYQESCPTCGSERIKRKEDSHWIFSIKSEQELQQYLGGPRLVLILFDRPEEALTRIRTRAWEIWPNESRHSYFSWFVQDYWTNNFQLKVSSKLNPAPLNLHPLKFDFYMMNPVLIFESQVDIESGAIAIDRWVRPNEDRSGHLAEPMPPAAVKAALLRDLVGKLSAAELAECIGEGVTEEDAAQLRQSQSATAMAKELTGLTETARFLLPRPVKKPKMTPSTYARRRQS